jgi:hypothetical protein
MLEHGLEGVKELHGHYDQRLLGRFALGPVQDGHPVLPQRHICDSR